MDWFSSDRLDSFRYVRVNPKTMEDTTELDVIRDGGEVAYNDLTSLKVSGSVPFIDTLDIGNDYLRIYSISELHGKRETIAQGTFIVASPVATITGKRSRGRQLREGVADLYSLLLILEQQVTEKPLSFPVGANAVSEAANLIRAAGLSVIAASSSSGLLTPATFDAGTSHLEVVNWLLKYAGFDSAEVDGYGNVRLRPYADPSQMNPVAELRDGNNCIFLPDVVHNLDVFEVPNKVIAVFSDESTNMSGVAVNADPANRYSTVSRGRVIAHVESVSQAATQGELIALALRVLQEKTSAVESIEIEHAFHPYEMGNALRLVYQQAGFDFVGVAVSKTLRLEPGMTCKARFRKFIRF